MCPASIRVQLWYVGPRHLSAFHGIWLWAPWCCLHPLIVWIGVIAYLSYTRDVAVMWLRDLHDMDWNCPWWRCRWGTRSCCFLGGFPIRGPTLGSRVHPCLSPEKKAKSLDEFASLAGVRTSRTSRWKVWCWNFWFSYQRSFHKKIPPPKFNDVALQKLPKPSRKGSSLPATIFQGRTC